MTTEDLIEALIVEGIRAYKKLNRNSPEGRKLTRKESVKIDNDVEFSCWREYAVYKVAEYLRDLLPDIPIEVTLDGNDSILQIEIDEKEQQRINGSIYSFLNGLKLI